MPETPPVPLDHLAADRAAYLAAKANAKSWSLVADVHLEIIKAALPDVGEGTIDGKPVLRHSTREVTRVDSKRLRADLPVEVLAPYLNTTVEHRYELLED